MPTYEYRCPNGHDFEEFFLKMSTAKSELPCPTCGKLGERRLSAGGGLLFKGSGFYITDYGKDGKKPAATSNASSGKGAPAAGEGAKSDASKSEAPKASDAKPAGPASTPAKGGE